MVICQLLPEEEVHFRGHPWDLAIPDAVVVRNSQGWCQAPLSHFRSEKNVMIGYPGYKEPGNSRVRTTYLVSLEPPRDQRFSNKVRECVVNVDFTNAWDETLWCACCPWVWKSQPQKTIVQSEGSDRVTSSRTGCRGRWAWSNTLARWMRDLDRILQMPGVLQALVAARRESQPQTEQGYRLLFIMKYHN